MQRHILARSILMVVVTFMFIGSLGVLDGATDCAENPLFTIEMYEQIRDGMPLQEVQRLLGRTRMQELGRYSSGGYNAVSYRWQNEDRSSLQITGQYTSDPFSGKVVSKSQFGLKPGRRVTCSDFNQVFTGTELHTVIRMIGQRGRLKSQEISAADRVLEWTWENDDDSSMKLTVKDGKVVAKSQMGLR